MNLYDILLLKALSQATSGGGTIDNAELQQIIKELETKVSYNQMETYVTQQIVDLPTISEDELEALLV